MYERERRGAWVGRELTTDSRQKVTSLRGSLEAALLAKHDRNTFVMEDRTDLPYVNALLLHAIRRAPHSQLPVNNNFVAQRAYHNLPHAARQPETGQLNSRCLAISTPHLGDWHYAGIILESQTLNRELRITDRTISKLGRIAIDREYRPRFMPIVSSYNRAIVQRAAAWLDGRTPQSLDFDAVTLDKNHLVQPKSFADRALVNTLEHPDTSQPPLEQ